MRIADREIGPDHPCYFIAELSCNHLNSKPLAIRLMEEAREAGAEAVKFQLYKPQDFTTPEEKPDTYKFFERIATQPEILPELREICRGLGLHFIITPFSLGAVDELEHLAPDAYKIASANLTDLELIRKTADTGRPLIISTGMGTQQDIHSAVQVATVSVAGDNALLHCVAGYPTPPDQLNMGKLVHMIGRYQYGFGIPVGLSEHTTEIEYSYDAACWGASIIERHFIIERYDDAGEELSPDSSFSLEPGEYKDLITAVREMEERRAQCVYGIMDCERDMEWRKDKARSG